MTVLMPTFRSSDFLGRAISSTLLALGREDRLLVHLDGRDGKSEAVLGRYSSDERLQITSSAENQGVAETLNRMASEVDSDYVARMDSDDICLPWRFSLQTRIMEQKKPNLLFSSALLFRTNNGVSYPNLLPLRGGLQTTQRLSRTLPNYNPLFTSTSFVDAETFQSLTPFTHGYEDYKSWLKSLITERKFFVGKTPTILYRTHKSQLSKTKSHVERSDDDPVLLELKTLARQFVKSRA